MGWRPSTGKGSIPRRLDLIYHSNMRSARAAGQWQRIQETKQFFPYLLYSLGPSQVHRDQHVAWAGTILPADDPWWNTNFPPNGWGCKCWVRQVSSAERERLIAAGKAHGSRVQTTAPPVEWRDWKNPATGRTLRVPKGISPGWEWNAGKDRMLGVRRAFADHIQKILAPICPPGFQARPAGVAAAACYLNDTQSERFARWSILADLTGPAFAKWLDSTLVRQERWPITPVALVSKQRAEELDILPGRVVVNSLTAHHSWGAHGPKSKERKELKLVPADWLLIQQIIDKTEPVLQANGRLLFELPRKNSAQAGYRLILDKNRDEMNPGLIVVTFFRPRK